MPVRRVRTIPARRVATLAPPVRSGPNTPPKRRVPSRRQLWALGVLLMLAGLVAGGWRFCTSSFFIIHDVRVVGASSVSPGAVADAAGIDGSRFFTLDATAAEERVTKLPWVARASVRRRFPHGATITIRERTPAGVWRVGGIDYMVADDGVVLDTAQSSAGGPVIDATRSDIAIRPGDHVDPDPLRAAARVMSVLSTTVAHGIVRFEYDRQDGLTVVMNTGALVRLGDGKDIDYKLAIWQTLVDKVGTAQMHEIDLRYGNRPFYR